MHAIFRTPARASLALALAACALSFPRAVSARETVVEDAPGRLVLEVTVPEYTVSPSEGGSRVFAPGFGAARAAAPDLPWFHFAVATGDRMPSVSIEPLEWVDLEVPGGVAPVPEHVSLRKSTGRRDAASFAAARSLVPEVSAFDTYRGMRIRNISVPFATFAEGEARVRALKRFRVRVDFPDPGAASNAGAAKWLRQSGVKNPVGGAHLVALPRPAPLRKAAAGEAFDPTTAWLKIRVGNNVIDDMAEDGLYALTYEAAAAKGLPAGVPVGKLRLYGGPKDTAGLQPRGAIAPTLAEVPVEIRESSPGNGTFDAGDTLFFYGHGTSIWLPAANVVAPVVTWRFVSDPYSLEKSYYLQWSGAEGGAARLNDSVGPAAVDTVTTAPHYLRAERDLMTGTCDPSGIFDEEALGFRYWLGRFSCTGPGVGSASPITYTASQLRSPSWDSLTGRASDSVWIGFQTFGFSSSTSSHFTARSGATLTNTLPFLGTNDFDDGWYLKTSNFGPAPRQLFDSVTWDVKINSGNPGNPAFEGYTVRYLRDLKWSEGRVVFPSATGKRLAYRVSDAPTGARVMRIVQGVGTRWISLQSVGGAAVFSDSVGAGEDVQYLFARQAMSVAQDALIAGAAPTADRVVQNLRDGSINGARRNPDYLIIAPAALLPEAVELAEYRDATERPGQAIALRPAVVRVEDIYRDWSGGRLSPIAIRDFLHWARDRWGAGDAQGDLKYVLLFGDGHFDYRNFRNGSNGTVLPNHIPPFLWTSNFYPGSGDPLATEDLYGVLDSLKSVTTSAIDLAVGRLPVQTREQARDYLDKIAAYEKPSNSGAWRSRALLTADDATQRRADGGRDPVWNHAKAMEESGDVMLASDSGMRKETIYLFDYPSNAAYLKPEASQALVSNLNLGALFFVFYGHGAYNQLADEVFLKTNDGLARLKNGSRNFGMMIFSCTVGRFDKLADEGMVEQFLRQKGNGAIFGIAGSRETFSDRNEKLGLSVMKEMFDSSTDVEAFGVGEILRRGKNGALNTAQDNRKYALLGEPVLVVNRPGLGLGIDSRPDSLQALGCDTIRGRVTRGTGRGAVSLRILSGDVTKTYSTWAGPIVATKHGQILFERTVPYVDSVFTMPFFLPKQVPFGDSTAKMQLFAWDSVEARESALLLKDLSISGQIASNSCLDNDNLGPRVAVTGCNVREAGEIDFPDKVRISLPYCLQVTVSDSGGGIYAGEGPDQGVTMELVGSLAPFQPQPTADDLYRKTYQVQLSPQEVADGAYLFKVSARDGFGNITKRQVSLEVANDTVLRFVRAFNTPNPLKRGETTFWFSTSLPIEEGGDLTAPNQDRIRFHVRVFNQRGYMVKEFRDARSGETRWDGRDAWGRTLANGVYFYEVSATWSEADGGPVGGRTLSRRNTLVISR